MNFPNEDVYRYLRGLHDRFDEPVLMEMEQLATERGFPIVGRTVGAALEMLARSVQAKRVFEMGSGFGFSAYWFARATGPAGEVYLTDGDAENEIAAKDHLTRAGLWEPCRFIVGDAIGSLGTVSGDFDVIYCDIDKGDYPKAFEAARSRVRVGGLYLCDNVLWSGRVVDDSGDEWTKAIREHNEMVFSAKDFAATVLPIRDGVLAALRLS